MDPQHNTTAVPGIPAKPKPAEESTRAKTPVSSIGKVDAMSVKTEMSLERSDGTNDEKDAKKSSDGSYIFADKSVNNSTSEDKQATEVPPCIR